MFITFTHKISDLFGVSPETKMMPRHPKYKVELGPPLLPVVVAVLFWHPENKEPSDREPGSRGMQLPGFPVLDW